MGKRLWGVCLMILLAVGCESTTLNHRTNDVMSSKAKGRASLTSLSRQSSGNVDSLSDHMIIPEAPEMEEKNNSKLVDPFPTVYFSFDSWEVNPDVRSRLDATAAWMIRFPNYELTIEGHTDVRGTESYNMVLGAKRAQAVKEYLKNLGIPSRRVDVVSFGKVLLLCDIDNESNCHQFNRRAELLLE